MKSKESRRCSTRTAANAAVVDASDAEDMTVEADDEWEYDEEKVGDG